MRGSRMATTELGTKHRCFQCGTKFYDLNRPEKICPKCKANQKNAPPESDAPKGGKEARRPAEVEVEPVELEIAGEEEEERLFDEEDGAGEAEEEDLESEDY